MRQKSRETFWLDQLISDFRFAVRSMRKYPVASVVAVISLAGGIGITTATLTIRDVLFLKPPPLYQNPERLSRVSVVTSAKPQPAPVPIDLYKVWTQQSELLGGIAGVAASQPREVR